MRRELQRDVQRVVRVFDYEGERCLATLPFCAGRAPSLSTLQQEAALAKGTSGERMMFSSASRNGPSLVVDEGHLQEHAREQSGDVVLRLRNPPQVAAQDHDPSANETDGTHFAIVGPKGCTPCTRKRFMERVREMLQEGGRWHDLALVFPPSAASDVMRIFRDHNVDILQTRGSVALQKDWHAYAGGAAALLTGGLVWQSRTWIVRGLTRGLSRFMSAEASGIWAARLGPGACGAVGGAAGVAAGVAVGVAVSAALPSMFQQRYQVVMQRREDTHEIIMLDSGLPSRELLLGREAEEMLASITGQAEFKQMIRDGAMVEHQNRLRSQAGTDTQRHRPGHVLLMGNPGTGKTTAARIYASVLYHLGLIKSNRLVEVQRGDLVGQYIGHTEHKTKGKISEARGGVLFVDEAYQLVEDRDSGGRDFGKKALEEIMSVMETGDPVIVFAGYPNSMKTFLAANDGLKRRIQHTFTFQDYSTRELAQIFLRKATGKKWRLREVTEEDVGLLFEKKTTPQSRSEHNGGLADRLLARSSKEQARRLEEWRTRAEVISQQMEQTLELEDIKVAMERLLQ